MSPDSQRANTFCSSGEAAVCGGNWPEHELVISLSCVPAALPTSTHLACSPVLGKSAQSLVPPTHWPYEESEMPEHQQVFGMASL